MNSKNESLLQDMLFVRTCRMVDLDYATKALEKAKPKNKEQVNSSFPFFN